MKRNELGAIKERREFEKAIAQKFAEWDAVREHGAAGETAVADGFVLNNIRHSILQLRQKRDKLYLDAPMEGQLTLFGGEVEPERPLPPMMPTGWMAAGSREKKRAYLASLMAKTA